MQPAQAQSVYPISADHAQGLTGSASPVVSVWPGYGTNLSFLPTDETIVRVWIDDPSRVALDFDEPLCPTAVETDCEAGNPSVIHLRRIQGLNFENLPQAEGTLLTVITETTDGEQHLYEFRIELATGTPNYHTVAINPASPIHPLLGLIDVEEGIRIAESRELIHREQDLWNRLQTFLSLARAGTDITTAAEQAGVSLDLIAQLAEWGKQARDNPLLETFNRPPLNTGEDHE
ncbi:MAG: hypothetical protein AAGF01_00145 [Cyanobacteria bacterium P01_G01_bin.38]